MTASFKNFPRLFQPRNGYRYNIDSFLLARFARFSPNENICDLGAGVGILGFLAILRGRVKKVTAVELQKDLGVFLRKNAEMLGVQDRIEIFLGNWKTLPKKFNKGSFDVVLSNPPYRQAKSGKVPPDLSKAIAKHEIEGSMADLVHSGSHVLKPEGRFYLMYPPIRLEELLRELAKQKLKLQRMAYVHPYRDRPATQVMVEAVASPRRELKIEAPVVVYRDPDHYQPDIEAWVGKKRRV